MSRLPLINHLVPFFQLKDTQGETFSCDTLLGQPYILYFYPKDNTSGCTAQACSFRDLQAEFDQLHTKIIGISPDDDNSHKKFIQKQALSFSLIADPTHEMCLLFNVWEQKKMYGRTYMGVGRATFLVDEKGMIRWIEKPVNVTGHSTRVIEAIKNLPQLTG
jgi:thioredoxin-dependent peroxiredoxin